MAVRIVYETHSTTVDNEIGVATGWLPGDLLRECDYGLLNGAPVEVVHARRLDAVDEPFPGGQSYRQVADGMRELLSDLLTDHDGGRVLLVGHAATRFALDHLLAGRTLESLVTSPFDWQEGWEYVLSATPG